MTEPSLDRSYDRPQYFDLFIVRTHLVRSVFATAGHLPLALLCGWAQAAPNLDEWVASNTTPTEKTLCSREVNGELFFVALAPDGKVRLGNRLDITGYTEAHVYSVAWVITNEKGGSVVAKVPPLPVAQRYVKEGSRLYADNVEYQTLNTASVRPMHVDVRIEKCAVWSQDSQSCQSARKAYTVNLCEIKS